MPEKRCTACCPALAACESGPVLSSGTGSELGELT